jgi:hypothetical protein
MLGIADNPIIAASAMPVRFGARRRRVNNDLHALKRTVPAVRVTSEAAKAEPPSRNCAGARTFPRDGRTTTSTGRRAGPDG